jgi:aspartate racemase
VGILAGMGPAAGVDFARLFVAACEDWLRSHGHAVCDQAYPEHWMAQLPIPDRTRALTDGAAPQPLEAMAQGLAQLAGLGARAVAMPCNTAHAWHAALQERVPQVELLHMPRETAAALRAQHGGIALAMACTEIPLALPQAPEAQDWTLIDPAAILARALARRAYGA